MGQPIEVNDTVKISPEQGFPIDDLNFEKHQSEGIKLEDITGKTYSFEKSGFRVYHHSPVRCFLVEDRSGKWICWGHIEVFEQIHTGENGDYKTAAKFRVIKLYDPEDQEKMTNYFAKEGLSYFQ